MIDFYMSMADTCASMSRAVRLHVGAVVVKENNIISFSWNGTPAGWDNTCEDVLEDGTLKTKPEVLHAERNALDKLAKGNQGGQGASLFVTHSPCLECAKSIYGAGINQVFYRENYRDDQGINFLKKCGVEVNQIK